MVEVRAKKRMFDILFAPTMAEVPKNFGTGRKLADLMNMPAIPGRGGRQPRVSRGFQTKATAELRAQLGEPNVYRTRGTELLVWEEDPEGNGAQVARLSSEDVQKGETSLGQIHGCRRLCEKMNLRPRYVLVVTKQSGESSFENRLDFQFLQAAIRRSEITWVAYREPDRVARNNEASIRFYRLLQEEGVDLYLSEMGRKMDWRNDKLMLGILGGVAEFELTQITDRMTGALRRRWLEEGRGWPNTQKFGFRRDKDDFLEVDPEQWFFVERAHFDYAGLCEPTGQGSLARLRKHLAELGCLLSKEKIRELLWDPIYSTGEWGITARKTGIYYPGRKIPLANPIPAELMAKNQALLRATRAKMTVTPLGTFLMNHVELLHARCLDGGEPTRLRGRQYGDRRITRPMAYAHDTPVPTECWGYTVPCEQIDEAVIDVLLDLARSPDLQREYALEASQRADWADSTEDPLEIRRKIGTLERSRAKLLREFTDDAGNGDISGAGSAQQLLEAINIEIQSLKARVNLLESIEDSVTTQTPEALVDAMRQTLRPGPEPSIDQRQRRVALIQALVSRVVIHDAEDGLELEISGALVPVDQTRVPVRFAEHFKEQVEGCHGPATTAGRSGRSVTDYFEGKVPLWKSKRVPIGLIPFRQLTQENIRTLMRWVDARAPLGRLFEASGSRWDEIAEDVPQLPSAETLQTACFKSGKPMRTLIREALGVEQAIRRGRVGPKGEVELILCMKMALDDGFTIDMGGARWSVFARSRVFLPCWAMITRSAGEAGVEAYELFEAASELEEDIPVVHAAPRALRRVKRRRQRMKETCVSSTDLGEIGFSLARLRAWRRSGKVIGYRSPGERAWMYPEWQFLPKGQIHPVASRVTEAIADGRVTFDELDAIINSEGSPPRPGHRLIDFLDDENSWDWIVQSVLGRLSSIKHMKGR